MAGTATKLCTACGSAHDLFLATADKAEPSKQYEYICPTTQTKVPLQVQDSDSWRLVDGKPREAIILRDCSGWVSRSKLRRSHKQT